MTIVVHRPGERASWSDEQWSALVGSFVIVLSPTTGLERGLWGPAREDEGAVLAVRPASGRVDLLTGWGSVVPVFADTFLASCDDDPAHEPHGWAPWTDDPDATRACFARMTAELDAASDLGARFGTMLDEPFPPDEAPVRGDPFPLQVRRGVLLWELIESRRLDVPFTMGTAEDPLEVRLYTDGSLARLVAWARAVGSEYAELIDRGRRGDGYELRARGAIGERAWAVTCELAVEEVLGDKLMAHRSHGSFDRLVTVDALDRVDAAAQAHDIR